MTMTSSTPITISVSALVRTFVLLAMPSLPPLPAAAVRPAITLPIRFYYKTVPQKKEEPFAKFGQFTIKDFQRVERQAEKTRQREKRSRPEVPQRTQQERQQRKVERRAEDRREKHIQPQLTAADPQRKREKQKRERKAVERVEHVGEQARSSPSAPDRAQQIVQKRGGDAEEERTEQRVCLFRE